jgi:hypothetical protein
LFGKRLDPWQIVVLEAATGVNPDGTWAAKYVAASVPRQNGKSLLMTARAVAGALIFGEKKIVISAHAQDTVRGIFDEILAWREESKALQARIPEKGIMKALNREAIRFCDEKGRQTSIIQFKARTNSGGRGFSCDLLLLDEAQRMSLESWNAINSTMSARENPQAWLFGTPPTPDDDGAVFTKIRDAALAGKSVGNTAYLEWSADPAADPSLPETCASANPAWHSRINHDVVAGEFATYDPAQFARERLGIWDPKTTARTVLPIGIWNDLAIKEPPADGVRVYGVKFSTDGDRVSVGAAVKPSNGDPILVESFGVGKVADGTSGIVKWLANKERKASQIVVDGRAGTGELITALRAAGVPSRRVFEPNGAQAVDVHVGFLNSVIEGSITHSAQPGLDAQVRVAGKRKIGNNGGYGWQSVTAEGDTTALDAVTLAAHFVKTARPLQPTTKPIGRIAC